MALHHEPDPALSPPLPAFASCEAGSGAAPLADAPVLRMTTPPRGGDAGFERFVHERAQPLRQFLLRMNVAEGDVQDVAQESLARLLRYRDNEPATAWQALLYRIAINVVRDRARHARVERDSAAMAVDAPSCESSPEQHASDHEQRALMRAAVMRLPPRCREIYLMHRIEEMTYSQIARHAGISLKAVEKNIARALRLMREQLKEVQGKDHEDDI